MKLTRVERWMLSHQHKILARLDPDKAGRHERIVHMLERGYELDLRREVTVDFEAGVSAEDAELVRLVLDMFLALQRSHEALGSDSPATDTDVVFPGFDGNNEAELLMYARFVLDGGEFDGLEFNGLNSHGQYGDAYTRMLTRWHECNDTHSLTANQLSVILDARKRAE